MTERRASHTAVMVCEGRAAAHGRIAPGRFADPTAMPLLRPEERAEVELVREERPPKDMKARISYEMIRGGAEVVVPRTVAIDDAIVEEPAEQVVILGAGLDGRAWRLVGPARFFEVDHPASQEDKRDRAAALADLSGQPPSSQSLSGQPPSGRILSGRPPTYVPVDFAHDVLTDALEAAGHRADRPTVWVWEGVVPYLTRPQVEATVAAAGARSATGSRFIVNYQIPSLLGNVVRKVIGAIAGRVNPWAAEPWRSAWTPAAMARLLALHGFAVRRDQDLLETATAMGVRLNQRYSLKSSRVAIATR